MYEIGDEIYCVNSFEEFIEGSMYRISGFGLAPGLRIMYSITKLYEKDIYYVDGKKIEDNFISKETYYKIKARDLKISELVRR